MTPAQILRVGRASTRCNTRMLIAVAASSFDNGEHVVSAITLRESARQLAEALIDYYAAWGAKMKNDRTSSRMVKCLLSRGTISGGDAAILYESLVLGNRFAHCILPANAGERLQAAIAGMRTLAEKFSDIIGEGDGSFDSDGLILESEVNNGR